MARVISTELQTLIDSGRLARRKLIRFDFPSGTYAFWNGVEPITWPAVPNPAAIVYNPGAGLIVINPIAYSNQGEVDAIELRLRSIPDTALTPDVLGTIHNEEWSQSPVQIRELYFDPATMAPVADVVKFTGRLDVLIDGVEPESSRAELVGTAESYLRDLTRKGNASASDVQHQILYPGDRFFEHAATVPNESVSWGRDPPKKVSS